MRKKNQRSTVSSAPRAHGNSQDRSIADAVTTLRERLSQSSLPPYIHGYQHERRQLTELLQRTVQSGESNSILLIGPRGAGKSMLLKSVLEEVKKSDSAQNNILVVHLNGLLQTDDRLALHEITRQLHLENTVGDMVFGSFAENLQFLLEALRSGDETSKPVIFILEEFDLFAQHRGQALLYNLFDVSQSAQTPICVVGITCRLDVTELLEKRVRSRFSHRQLHLFNNISFMDYVALCISYLSLRDFPDQDFASRWNKNIKEVVESATVRDVLNRQFTLSKDVRGLLMLLTPVICDLSLAHPSITASDFVESFKSLSTDSKSSMLHGLSILELCLIIAMKHLTDIYQEEPFNFEMVYSEYLKFAQQHASVQVFDKAVVLKAFEHLVALELIRPMDSRTIRIQKEYRLMTLLLHPAQILDTLQKYPNCPTDIKHWAASSFT
ncbi:origin recognition complex subunit 4-like [Pomacea canaliculata]|nr:origin recognition complex subunit 4-like [Pomacea canaliculata]XP_025084559.1 origin recognition complex subunit 4-like [Pomacea canaliculata]XP_025084560.1 origin recognition complex subunit 4-like [Pomacea canaliculata]